MISISPPVVKPYAPATRPIAFVSPMIIRDEASSNRFTLQFWFLDAKKARITIDPEGVPSNVVTGEQLAAFAASPATAGDTFDQDIARRALPILQANFGLTGMVEAPAAIVVRGARRAK